MTSRARQDPPTTDPAERARFIALTILDRAPRSAADLKARLMAKEVPEDIADHIVERYIEVGLLDDAALAATIARTRHAERGLAPRAIALELRRKGFAAADIDAALEPLDIERQHATAVDVARKRWERYAGLDPEVRARRIIGHLGRKGYAPGLAMGIVRDLMLTESTRVEEGQSWTPSSP